MQLDLAAAPTLVLTGAWNPSIFSPAWLARYLFGYGEGQEAQIAQLLAVQGETPRQTLYLRNIGFHAEQTRVELFANSIDSAYLSRLEGVLLKLIETLPHTPMGSLGVNFRFYENAAADSILAKLDTLENLSDHYKIISSHYRTTLSFDEHSQCLVERSTSNDDLRVDFNYHFEKFADVKEKSTVVSGIVQSRLRHALHFMNTIYDLDGYETMQHEFSEMGEDWGTTNG